MVFNRTHQNYDCTIRSESKVEVRASRILVGALSTPSPTLAAGHLFNLHLRCGYQVAPFKNVLEQLAIWACSTVGCKPMLDVAYSEESTIASQLHHLHPGTDYVQAYMQ
jgi:hypothetical protein